MSNKPFFYYMLLIYYISLPVFLYLQGKETKKRRARSTSLSCPALLLRLLLHQVSSCHRLDVNALAMDPLGRFLVTGANDQLVKVWANRPKEEVSLQDVPANQAFVGHSSAIKGDGDGGRGRKGGGMGGEGQGIYSGGGGGSRRDPLTPASRLMHRTSHFAPQLSHHTRHASCITTPLTLHALRSHVVMCYTSHFTPHVSHTTSHFIHITPLLPCSHCVSAGPCDHCG